MPVPFLDHVDLAKNELRNFGLQKLASAPASPVKGQAYFDESLGYGRLYSGTEWLRLDHKYLTDLEPPQNAVNFNDQRITSVADPTANQDAATKSYVDATVQGLDVKASVTVATTGNITLSGTQTVDGVALDAGDRVLVRAQTDATANGIYVVDAGAWTRAEDANSNEDVHPGVFVFVEEGTNYADSGWVLTTDAPVVVGTSPLEWSRFSGAGQIAAGTGLTKDGNTLDVNTGPGLVANADQIDVDWAEDEDVSALTKGAANAAGVSTEVARADHVHAVAEGHGGFARYHRATITGDGASTAFTVTHNLGERFVTVQVIDQDAPYDSVWTDVERPSTNTVEVKFALPPANAKSYVVTVVG